MHAWFNQIQLFINTCKHHCKHFPCGFHLGFWGKLERENKREKFGAMPTFGHHTSYIACLLLVLIIYSDVLLAMCIDRKLHVTWYVASLKLWTIEQKPCTCNIIIYTNLKQICGKLLNANFRGGGGWN